jgi:hypothetical protein
MRLLLILLLLTSLGLSALVWFGLSDHPRVAAVPRLSHQDIARARQLIASNDPRKLPAGAHRRLTLSEADLNLAANYLLQKYARGNAWVSIGPEVAHLEASIKLLPLPRRGYLNLSLTLRELPDGPRLTNLKFGQLRVPDRLTALLVREMVARIGQTRGASLALASIKQLELADHHLNLVYEWRPELLDAVRDDLMPYGQADAMAIYHHKLVSMQAAGQARQGSLANALPPLFALAAARSRDNDPVTENRALLAVLGAWGSRHGMNRLVPRERQQGQLGRFRLKLQRRTDFGRHFLTSAALAANSDSLLADAIGLYKEVRDSQRGSGFSFTDIAADRAGTRLGEVAVSSPQRARQIQHRIAAGVAESDLMPPARDLPEHMSAAEFERRFGGVDSPAYRRMMAEIEARIARLPLYR